MRASLPYVMGTEHEYVISINAPTTNQFAKWREEFLVAREFLKALKNRFYPKLARAKRSERFLQTLLGLYLSRISVRDRDRLEICLDTLEDSLGESGFFTPLGGRMYIDHCYFEGSTPECDDPFTLLACELAQEEIMVEVFQETFGDDPRCPRLYKNVSDGKGNSQAAHRNFGISRQCWARITSPMVWSQYWTDEVSRETKFLATWHIVEMLLGGAGKYGAEDMYGAGRATLNSPPQISGRADFIEFILGRETVLRRPLINQRDEALADDKKYGRYHCICGDANRAEWPHIFKMGLTAIILGMIADDALSLDFYIEDPVHALQRISQDTSCQRRVLVRRFGGGNLRAYSSLDIMKFFLKDAGRYLSSRSVPAWCEKIYDKASSTIWALENNPRDAETILDWKIKERIMRGKDGQIRSNAYNLHLNYHALASPVSLYKTLKQNGCVETVISPEMIEKYKSAPPETTRAYFRGNFLKHLFECVMFYATHWQEIIVCPASVSQGVVVTIDMPEPLDLTKEKCGDIFEIELSHEERFSRAWSLLEQRKRGE